MKISIPMDKDVLLRRVQYKYAVLHNKDKSTWEFIPRKVAAGEYANRILLVPREQIYQLTGE